MAVPLWLRKIWAFRNTIIIIMTPLIYLPIPLAIPGTEAACGYTILWMATYWITEAVPLGVTGFLPLIIFPLSGIMSGDDVSKAYVNDTTWLFIGGMIIAISVEVSGLHKRIALRVLLIVGPKPRCLMLGFMGSTFFLSMWISNTATTAMMLPIVEAVFLELRADEERRFRRRNKIKETKTKFHKNSNNSLSSSEVVTVESYGTSFSHANPAFEETEVIKEKREIPEMKFDDDLCEEYNAENCETEEQMMARMDNLIKGITLCVPYSASIGGTATLTGTTPNLILAGEFNQLFPESDIDLSFGNWLVYSLPGALVTVVLGYFWLQWWFLGFNFREIQMCFKGSSATTEGERNAKRVIVNEYKKLGPIKWKETTVLLVFITTALLWFFRHPGFMPGWSELFKDDFPSDGTVAMAMAFLLFVLPNDRPSFLRNKNEKDIDGIRRPVPPILDWPTVHKKFPWNILFLLCGGFALAKGATESGFSQWLADLLTFLDGIEPWAICLVVTIIVCLFTECSSNVATASLFAPILGRLAQNLEIHPLYLMFPPNIASSLAFMLPVATAPNAIAFSYGHLVVADLVKAGWMMNILGIFVISLFINTYGMSLFNLGVFPEWAADVVATTVAANVTTASVF